MSVDPIPEGAQIVVPYLLVPDADREMRFLAEAFGARETLRQMRPDGAVMHIELTIGDTDLMMGEPKDENPGPMPCTLYLRVEDCDEVYARALELGGESVMEPMDMIHAGERYGGVKDPAGNIWWIGTRLEDVFERWEISIADTDPLDRIPGTVSDVGIGPADDPLERRYADAERDAALRAELAVLVDDAPLGTGTRG